jgi:hypothetical protein
VPLENGSPNLVRTLVRTMETWISPDLGIVVLSRYTSTDPRLTGENSSEIQKLDRSEPDPALFEIPAGYKIETVSLDPQEDRPAGSANTQQPSKQP